MDRRSALRAALLAAATATGALSAGALSAVPAAGAAAGKKPGGPPAPRDILLCQWVGSTLAEGVSTGTTVTGGALAIASPAGQRSYTDPYNGTTGTYDYAIWTSPEIVNGFAATEAVASWTASTPGGTWIEVQLRGVTALGNTTAWYVMGRWAAEDTAVARTSVPAQTDADGSIAIDTFIAAADHGLTRWQVRVSLYRPVGTTLTPQVSSIGAMASRLPAPGSVVPSPPAQAQGVVLNVPPYSQNVHVNEYPEWNGGGEAWCSPTSTSMILAYWATGPTPADYAWVDPSYADPWVDHAARNTYDNNYQGTGNWPFNTAYAGRYGLQATVTRLRSLNEAEAFIAAGIPLVCSLSFKKNEIPGLTYGTNGHLLVLAGFTATGQPVLNDPAAPDDAAVRKTVGRDEFEAAWLNTSGGIVYLVHPGSVPLPAAPAQANW